MIKNIIFFSFLFFYSLTNVFCQENFKFQYQLEEVSRSVANPGAVKYSDNCSSCVKIDVTKLGKLYSPENKTTIEISVLTEEEAIKLFDELASNKDIPFQYPIDGCFARAHKMSLLMDSKGIVSGKAFIEGDLYVITELFGKINWWYHVAPVILIKVKDLNLPYILDPSLFKKPVPYEEWRDSMNNGKKKNIYNEYYTNRFAYTPDDKVRPPKLRYSEYDLLETDEINKSFTEILNQVLKK